jgi:iron-sulfur cluster assembly protein
MNDNSMSANQDHAITITSTAVDEIKRLLSRESEKDLFLRIGVAPGGCSGMSYLMAFDHNQAEHDHLYDYDGLKVVIDSRVLSHLKGSILDYKMGLLGGGFQFENPNARRSCGCGSSFTC